MNVVVRKPMTLDEFLAWEECQELRYEFDGFRPVAMTGGTFAHSSIQRNLIVELSNRLRGRPCQPHGSHLKIEVAGRIRYPDAFVVCSPFPPGATVVTTPVVVFEILSDSTASDDLITKNAEYQATPSIKRYVILQQGKAGAIVFFRRGEDWVSLVVSGLDATLDLPEIEVELPLAAVYAGVELDVEPGAGAALFVVGGLS